MTNGQRLIRRIDVSSQWSIHRGQTIFDVGMQGEMVCLEIEDTDCFSVLIRWRYLTFSDSSVCSFRRSFWSPFHPIFTNRLLMCCQHSCKDSLLSIPFTSTLILCSYCSFILDQIYFSMKRILCRWRVFINIGILCNCRSATRLWKTGSKRRWPTPDPHK
jgi:hypothetical protein